MWAGLTPVLILHVLLLPLNTLRRFQLRHLSEQLGRRAFVSFPDLTLLRFLRAYLPIF
ncbi:MAG TPA: hypothetical protein VLA02_13900 [Reyranella sp.]|nr:hypothetical protein [Reyranella sp.]